MTREQKLEQALTDLQIRDIAWEAWSQKTFHAINGEQVLTLARAVIAADRALATPATQQAEPRVIGYTSQYDLDFPFAYPNLGPDSEDRCIPVYAGAAPIVGEKADPAGMREAFEAEYPTAFALPQEHEDVWQAWRGGWSAAPAAPPAAMGEKAEPVGDVQALLIIEAARAAIRQYNRTGTMTDDVVNDRHASMLDLQYALQQFDAALAAAPQPVAPLVGEKAEPAQLTDEQLDYLAQTQGWSRAWIESGRLRHFARTVAKRCQKCDELLAKSIRVINETHAAGLRGHKDEEATLPAAPPAAEQAAPPQTPEPVAYCDIPEWLRGAMPEDCFSRIPDGEWTPLYATPEQAAPTWADEIEERLRHWKAQLGDENGEYARLSDLMSADDLECLIDDVCAPFPAEQAAPLQQGADALLDKLRAYLPKRGDRENADRWLGDGVHESVSVRELIAAIARSATP